MKRLFLVFGIAGLLCIKVWASDQQANFSGTWQLDTKLSDAAPKGFMVGEWMWGVSRGSSSISDEPGSGMGRYKTLVIQQTESEIQIAYTGANVRPRPIISDTSRQSLAKRQELAKMFAKKLNQDLVEILKLDERKNALSKQKFTVDTSANGSLTKKEFSLSKDGKIMVLKISTSAGAKMMSEKLVYHLMRAEADHR
jgi:hypothetical protein